MTGGAIVSTQTTMSDTTEEEVAATTWQDSILELQSLLASTTIDRDTNFQISSLCSTILNNSSNNNNEDVDASSESILSIVITIYLRALIQLGQYSKVVDYSNNSSSSSSIDNNTQEVAYALYRLRKYDACRKLIMSSSDINDMGDENEEEGNGSSSSSSSGRLMAHIHAQTLYRLGETNLADELYANLLNLSEEEGAVDNDEREDTLSNALANRIANYTPGSMLQNDGTSKVSWLEEDESIRQLIQSYGEGNNNCDDDDDDDDEEMNMLQNYDLAYNLATYMLLSSDGRSQSQVVQAKRLLEHAEKSALTILDSTSPEEDEEDGAGVDGDEEDGGVGKEVTAGVQDAMDVEEEGTAAAAADRARPRDGARRCGESAWVFARTLIPASSFRGIVSIETFSGWTSITEPTAATLTSAPSVVSATAQPIKLPL